MLASRPNAEIKLFGAGWLSLKLISLIPAILTVAAIYFLGRLVFGPAVGLGAMLLMGVALALIVGFPALADSWPTALRWTVGILRWVLLLAVFPRGQEANHEARAKIKQINDMLAAKESEIMTI